jgi:EAL domain-containing protein (putative c-di-GMP-specific phosphodiesterase class I)/FixJ family two-component response regulator/GGDEF domain-containing protein
MTTHISGGDQAALEGDSSSLRDEDTGFLKPQGFLTQLDQRLLRCAQSSSVVAVAQLSFRGFRELSETLGEHVAETLFSTVAETLRPMEKEGWLLGCQSHYRLLIATCPCNDKGDAVVAMTDLLERFTQPVLMDGMELFLQAQAGLAIYPQDGDHAQRLLQCAKRAYTSAVIQEHAGLLSYSDELGQQIERESRLVVDLRSAISRNQLSLRYQPQVDLRTGQIVAVEALMSWSHPEYGDIDQAQIMRLAELSSQIIAIGEWVVARAAADVQRVHRSTNAMLRVSMVMSPRQFRQADGIARLSRLLRDAGLDAGQMEVAFTETAIRGVDRSAQELLYKLKELGISLTLNDFGTGASSLSFLKTFPIDRIKIHSSFIQNIARRSDDHAVVRGIISMAQSLKIGTIADGVSKETQHAVVARMGCETAQGTLYAQPLSVEELNGWINSYVPGSFNKQDAGAESDLKTILLVDDEANVLSALKRLLRKDGYQIFSTTSAAEAFEILGSNKVGVIVSDQRMPEMNGTEFLAQVKEIYPNTMRMVLSGYTELQSVTDAINKGAIYKFLTKPWDDEQLRANIAEAFRRLQVELENAALHKEVESVNTELVRLNHVLEQRVMEKNERIARDTDYMLVLQEVLDNISVGIIGVDNEGGVALSNQQADYWLGPENSTLVGESIGELPKLLNDALGSALLAADFTGSQTGFSFRGQAFTAMLSPMGKRSLSKGVLVTMRQEP